MFKNQDKLLHMVMKELCRFAEKQTFKQYPDSVFKSLQYLANNTKEMKLEYQELNTIYKWYKLDRPKRKQPMDIADSMMYYEQDTKMLARAVSLRKFSKRLFKGGDYVPEIQPNQASQKSIREGRNIRKAKSI